MSAQLASLYCMACEYVQYKSGLYAVSFYKTRRFRDNIIIFALSDFSYQEILYYLTHIYKLDFTKENSGQSLTCLEFRVKTIRDKNNFISHLSLRWKGSHTETVPRPEMSCKKMGERTQCKCKIHMQSIYTQCTEQMSDIHVVPRGL